MTRAPTSPLNGSHGTNLLSDTKSRHMLFKKLEDIANSAGNSGNVSPELK